MFLIVGELYCIEAGVLNREWRLIKKIRVVDGRLNRVSGVGWGSFVLKAEFYLKAVFPPRNLGLMRISRSRIELFTHL